MCQAEAARAFAAWHVPARAADPLQFPGRGQASAEADGGAKALATGIARGVHRSGASGDRTSASAARTMHLLPDGDGTTISISASKRWSRRMPNSSPYHPHAIASLVGRTEALLDIDSVDRSRGARTRRGAEGVVVAGVPIALRGDGRGRCNPGDRALASAEALQRGRRCRAARTAAMARGTIGFAFAIDARGTFKRQIIRRAMDDQSGRLNAAIPGPQIVVAKRPPDADIGALLLTNACFGAVADVAAGSARSLCRLGRHQGKQQAPIRGRSRDRIGRFAIL